MLQSDFDPFASDRRLVVYVDIKSPYAFIAKDPTRDLARLHAAAIDWRPLTLDIPSYLGSARLDDAGRVVESRRSEAQWAAVRYAYKDARRYAALRGQPLRGTTKIWDSTLAGMALLWAKAQSDPIADAYLDLTFSRFWKRELDIEDRAVVKAVLVEAGADVVGFADFASDEKGRYEAMQRRIFDAGIFGVPGYVLEGQYYFGREHLPRIGWILSGRHGQAPDIAYRSFASGSR